MSFYIEFAEEFNGQKTLRTVTQQMPEYAMRWFFSTAVNMNTFDEQWHNFDIMAFVRFFQPPAMTGSVSGAPLISYELKKENPTISDNISAQCDEVSKDIFSVVSQIGKCHRSQKSTISWRGVSSKSETSPQSCIGDFKVKITGFKKSTADSGYGKMNRWEHNMETFLFLLMIVYDFPWCNQCVSIDLRQEILQHTGWEKITEDRIGKLNTRIKNMKAQINISYMENGGWKWDGNVTQRGKQQIFEILGFTE